MFVLTIDQESSRTAGDRVDDFLELLSDAVATHADVLVRPFERTVGDEVQGVTSSADLAVELALVALRTGEWQVGIGAGRVDCLLYTSDAADDLLCVDLGGRRIIK